MTSESKPFVEYWEAVDEAMLKFFGIDIIVQGGCIPHTAGNCPSNSSLSPPRM